ncbi:diguanylate cyclase [Gandjariella thermophila]|uniref:GGDEF domain-containing protein n=1 Tax=Gandjariella thermophila TaxID=1931992 RepID=A0A4D4J6Y2_9PSEU|nr:diguanylate cyclase [Gandjariella thermophila]GDY30902.1 GGDEF domain-containing protein [Gandjariella thermophila]
MRTWTLWSLRRPALAYWLLVDLAAIACTALVVTHTPPPDAADLGRFTMIAATAGAVVIGTTLASQMRREPQRNPWAVHVCYLAAGVCVLPLNLLALLFLGPALHGVMVVRPEPHRWLFTLSASALGTFAGRFVIGWHETRWDVAHLLLAGAALLLTRTVLVAVGLRLRNPGAGMDEIIGDSIDVTLGIVAVSIGALMGTALLFQPSLGVLAGPPMALLERAAQLPHWRRSAQRDAKTGLANAVHWDRLARYELSRARARSQPVAVMLLDLDHFKRVNDRVGHLAGDAALAAVALRLRASVRRGDVVGRFGGEEFVVLLPDTEPPEAEAVAQRVRLAVAAMHVPTTTANGDPYVLDGLTVSIGVATSVRYGYELPDLLIAADAALLSAKGFGRNLVAMA